MCYLNDIVAEIYAHPKTDRTQNIQKDFEKEIGNFQRSVTAAPSVAVGECDWEMLQLEIA